MRATIRFFTPIFTMNVLVTVFLAVASYGQDQSRSQQQCLRDFTKQTARVQRALGKNAVACIRNAGRGRESDPQDCVQGDPRGGVARAQSRLADRTERSCDERPDFGTSDATGAGFALADEQHGLLARLYGSDLDAALVSDKAGARCQSEVTRRATRFQDAQWRAVVGATKQATKDGVDDAANYTDTLLNALEGDRKVAGVARQIEPKIERRCDEDELAELFPGTCAEADDFAGCVETAAACSFCRSLGAAAELALDCDVYDDGEANESCRDVASPLYVAEDGDDANPGTRDEPLATLERALERADDEGFGEVRMAAGSYTVEGVYVVDGVDVIGGFDPATFAPGGGETVLEGASGPWVLEAAGIHRPTRLERLTVRSADRPIGPSIAIRVEDSSGLTIRDAVIEAGDGGDGRDGSPGRPGADGGAGGRGGNFRSEGFGGIGGDAGYGGVCFSPGGRGGDGGGAFPVDGRPGSSGSNNVGMPDTLGGFGCSHVFDCTAEDGAAGEAGVVGGPGPDGSGGMPGLNGRNGGAGQTGSGGSGGGGGGGRGVTGQAFGGGGGGGGGEGGCSGESGEGGEGGGHSIGIWATRASLGVFDSVVSTRDAGQGGNGAPGGAGGDGGQGGLGGSGGPGAGGGGNGAPGGAGGDGGRGGGGGGGSSIGILLDSAELTQSGNTVVTGRSGGGGSPDGQSGNSFHILID